jgi:hypothetical protein
VARITMALKMLRCVRRRSRLAGWQPNRPNVAVPGPSEPTFGWNIRVGVSVQERVGRDGVDTLRQKTSRMADQQQPEIAPPRRESAGPTWSA